MSKFNRRQFLGQSAAALGLVASGTIPAWSAELKPKRSCIDRVVLGNSGVTVTRLGLGTGTNGGDVQRSLGQTEFTKLVRYAYDQGIRFFDTADNYGMHGMLCEALKGIDRSTYAIQTKLKLDGKSPLETIDRFRKELNSDYFDSLLLHCLMAGDWKETMKRQQDEMQEAKDKKLILSHGASCHGTIPLRTFSNHQWLDVALLRVNHNGTHMDGPTGEWTEIGSPEEVVSEIQKIHTAGTGVIGMKLVGNGEFTSHEVREASVRYVMSLDCIDACIVGFKSQSEVDEMMKLMDQYLNV